MLSIFSGHDTKLMQKSIEPPSYNSGIKKKMDYIIHFLFSVLVFIEFVGSIAFSVKYWDDMPNWCHIRLEDAVDNLF